MKHLPTLAIVGSCLLMATSCGNTDGSSTLRSAPETSTPASSTTQTTISPVQTTVTTASAPVATLAEVCPSPLVIQTDWFPEAEHGGTYNLLGDSVDIDVDAMIVRGELQDADMGTGVELEIRTGGPAIGDQQVSAQMFQDPDITFGFVNSDESLAGTAQGLETLAVAAPLDVSPQMIMWSPDVYPDVHFIQDLKDAQVEVFVFSGDTFVDYLIGSGILEQNQVNGSYDGSPGNFLASGGTIAQQGFASSEPFSYEFEFEDWLRPMKYDLIHDTGYELYVQQLVIRRDAQQTLDECLKLFVPIFQQSTVDYIDNPDHANRIIVEAVAAYDSFWVYGPEIAEYSHRTQVDLGLISNGGNETMGDFDFGRIQGVIDILLETNSIEMADGVSPQDIATNEYLDPTIAFSGP